jgi:ribosome assembly protein YihI (activator of Der GTPase)
VDGFTRGANGRAKFNKDTKKRQRDKWRDHLIGSRQMVPLTFFFRVLTRSVSRLTR